MIRHLSTFAVLAFALSGCATTSSPGLAGGSSSGGYYVAAQDGSQKLPQSVTVDNIPGSSNSTSGVNYPYMQDLWWVRGPRYSNGSTQPSPAAADTVSMQSMSRAVAQPAVASSNPAPSPGNQPSRDRPSH